MRCSSSLTRGTELVFAQVHGYGAGHDGEGLMQWSLLALWVLILLWPFQASAFTADKRDTLRQ